MKFRKAISSPYIHHPPYSTAGMMFSVILALLPALAIYALLFGWGVVVNAALAVGVALVCEAGMLAVRRRPLFPTLGDGSAILTALLLVFALPPLAPWWLTTVGVAFAIIVAKQLYGGLGFNPFNPAMVGYVVLLVSFPKELTLWSMPLSLAGSSLDVSTTLSYIFSGSLPDGITIDALTAATPLDTMKTQLGLGRTPGAIAASEPVFGFLGGKGWIWVNLTLLAGGLWLIRRRVISWHIPVALLGSLAAISSIFYLLDSAHNASPLFHLFSGAAILGAFFIATDPVTAATSNLGRLWYGAGIGVLIYVIRSWGGFPDGVAFAVLLMNMAAPTIDHYTKPRVFGHGDRDA